MKAFRHIFTPQEQKLLLVLSIFILVGSILNLFGYKGKEDLKQQAADSLEAALQEDEEMMLDLRFASMEELMCLPGIGEKRAQDILNYRETNPFTSMNQIMLVKGIGVKTYRRILPYLIAFGDSTAADESSSRALSSKANRSNIVNINTAGQEELCTLMRIGPSRAEAIIKYREQNGLFNTIEDLLQVKGIGTKTLELNRKRISL
ncbi:MAG: ComEA family DNA-binding protein [Candidatus Cloacimonetes bacterium]|nr:ComEA family DNA-binding protein [Candidatus Cloacimonadota bacterium]MDD2505697.1 ComEA family DNA-binding protein [Candidatus Cloacimonadota bacterium]MDD4559119.1 ComEA family DNA-binding protein [Candidatus Cloacimonadota bacterium]